MIARSAAVFRMLPCATCKGKRYHTADALPTPRVYRCNACRTEVPA